MSTVAGYRRENKYQRTAHSAVNSGHAPFSVAACVYHHPNCHVIPVWTGSSLGPAAACGGGDVADEMSTRRLMRLSEVWCDGSRRVDVANTRHISIE